MKGKKGTPARARAVYDWTIANTHRDDSVEGCGLGQAIRPLTEANGGGRCIVNLVTKICADRVAFIFLDVEKHPAEKEKYGVKSFATPVFYDASGKERDRRTGYLKEGEMKRILDGLLAE